MPQLRKVHVRILPGVMDMLNQYIAQIWQGVQDLHAKLDAIHANSAATVSNHCASLKSMNG